MEKEIFTLKKDRNIPVRMLSDDLSEHMDFDESLKIDKEKEFVLMEDKGDEVVIGDFANNSGKAGDCYFFMEVPKKWITKL